MNEYILRQLSYHADGEEIPVEQDALLSMNRNIVILGEAGMGKSRLLQSLEGVGGRFVLARRLLTASDPSRITAGAEYVLIDALDEVASYKQGDAVDQLVAKLEEAGSPNFILSCRAEDWREATARSMIEAAYGEPPVEMSLRPFDERQIKSFLTEALGQDQATKVFGHYDARGFGNWLGNPQTLGMLAKVVAHSALPESTTDLFSRYVDIAWSEANQVRREGGAETDKEVVLDTLGAVFCAIILTGKEGISKKGTEPTESFVSIGELGGLPGFAGWEAIEGNRLLANVRQEAVGFTYIHRRVGEWLSARWLSKYTNNERKRARLLDNIVVQGIVPASIRGVFAWLAQDAQLAEKIAKTDPMALIEYGDADVLSSSQGKALLEGLTSLADRDPWFAGYGHFRARALVKGGLRSQSLAKLTDQGCQPRLRLLLAEQFKGEILNADEAERFRRIVLDPLALFDLRVFAAEALVGNFRKADWQGLVSQVLNGGDIAHARLAAEIVLAAGFENFDNDEIAEVVMSAGGFGKRGPMEDDSHVGTLWRYRHEFPEERLEDFLDVFSSLALARLPEYRSIESSDVINLGDSLVARSLSAHEVEPSRLLHWLEAFGGKDSYFADDEKAIAAYIRDHDEVRRVMQQEWLGKETTAKGIRDKAFKLERVHPSLTLSDDDLAHFLSTLPSRFPDWQELAWLVRQNSDDGSVTREALRRFAEDPNEYETWLDRVLNPEKPDWLIEQEERAAKRKEDRETRWANFKSGLATQEEALTHGQFGVLIQATNVYANRFSDLHELDSNEARLHALLGEKLTGAFRQGLEAWLNKLPQWPHSEMIAVDYANNKAWSVRYILLSALAERLKRNGTLDPLDDDQVISAQLHIANHTASGDEWKNVRDAVWERVSARPDLFERYARLACETSLSKGNEIVSGLYEIIREAPKKYRATVITLAEEWLRKFWRMHWRAESELVDLLLSNREFGTLQSLVPKRLGMKSLVEERRRNWEAVGLIVDFPKFAKKTAARLVADPELFWAIRERLGARRPYSEMPSDISSEIAGWLVENGRQAFPLTGRPNTVTMGDTNPWDASEAISRLIGLIGANKSEDAGRILERLAEADDGYRDRILSTLAEHRQARAEMAWRPIQPSGLSQILLEGAPESVRDLQSEVLRLLRHSQDLITSNDTDSWRNFYNSDRKTPKDEEDCSDALIDVLRQFSTDIKFSPEKHLGDDRETDIACEIGDLHLPIEVKGQWHPELWRAADSQLQSQQAVDHRAEGFGIFLVLWFGETGDVKKLVGPPRGSGVAKPKTPLELEQALRAKSKAARAGQVEIKVLDLSRA